MDNIDFFDMDDKPSLIYELQNMLYYLSFFDKSIPKVYPDGIYSQETENAVAAFQAQNGIAPTGIVDHATWVILKKEYMRLQEENAPPAPIAIFPSSVYETQTGETSGIITVIQILLDDLAHHLPIDRIEQTGVNDEATMNAVRQYQLLRSLPQTGLVDKRTWDALAEDYKLFDKKSE